MNNIIVTGATSMIGVALIEEAISEGINVYAIVRPNTTRIKRLPKSNLISIVNCDLDGLEKLHIPVACDTFYHFAWSGTTKEQRDDPFINERNIQYTFDAVEVAKRSGCKKFIGAGSQAEYGPVKGTIDENTRFSPAMSYGISKYAAGKLSRKLCNQHGMVHIWGRIFSVYGRWDNKNTLIDYAITKFQKGEKAQFSSGIQKWNYLFERDAGRLFLAMGEKIEESSEYIVASDETRPLREFIEILADEMECRELCEFAEEDGGNVFGIEPIVNNTLEKLDFHDFISFKQGIKQVLKNYS